MNTREKFPRSLTDKEWKMIEWILPDDRPGYRKYRDYLRKLVVIGKGRWGEGDIILGSPDDAPDISGPMERVFAHGLIETNTEKISVTVHEYDGSQLELQIVNVRGDEIPDAIEINKKTTYSNWNPGNECPFCSNPVREVTVKMSPQTVLVFCIVDNHIWLYEGEGQINYPIPVTNYYNELMLYKQIKDPAIALKSRNLFSMIEDYSDEDLRQAFIRYNKQWHRISIDDEESQEESEKSLSKKIVSLIRGKNSGRN